MQLHELLEKVNVPKGFIRYPFKEELVPDFLKTNKNIEWNHDSFQHIRDGFDGQQLDRNYDCTKMPPVFEDWNELISVIANMIAGAKVTGQQLLAKM